MHEGVSRRPTADRPSNLIRPGEQDSEPRGHGVLAGFRRPTSKDLESHWMIAASATLNRKDPLDLKQCGLVRKPCSLALPRYWTLTFLVVARQLCQG
jgi:hypothetical protein